MGSSAWSVPERQIDVLAGMRPPAPAEDLPLRRLAAGEDGGLLDPERAAAAGRHEAEHPGLEGPAADEDHLPAAGIVAQQVQEALKPWAVGADGLATEFLDVAAVRLRIDLVDHRLPPLTRRGMMPLCLIRRQRRGGRAGPVPRFYPVSLTQSGAVAY